MIGNLFKVNPKTYSAINTRTSWVISDTKSMRDNGHSIAKKDNKFIMNTYIYIGFALTKFLNSKFTFLSYLEEYVNSRPNSLTYTSVVQILYLSLSSS